jgi:hypothetical protein
MLGEKKLFFVFHVVGELVGFTESTNKTQAAKHVKDGKVIPIDPIKISGLNQPRIDISFTYEDMEEFVGLHTHDQANRLRDAFILSTYESSRDKKEWCERISQLQKIIDAKSNEKEL